MQELMRELIMQGMQHLPERQLRAETAEVLRPQPRQALPGHAAEQAGPAIYTGRDIWQDSTPITSATSHPLQGRLPRQRGVLLPLQTAAAHAITAIIAVIGTIAAIAVTAVLKNCRSKIPEVWGLYYSI